MPESLAPELAPKLAVELGLNLEEYEKVVVILGRIPTLTELYMYSLMWSEHCSYKHSRKALRMFPTEGPAVLQGPGENAGVIGVGDGWALAFKMESHNHPSAIEPYQGAATGIGGIIRDIFTMGARPIASLNSLRFGTLDKPRQRYLFEGSVAGIGGYGNCLGVPTVGGEVYFEEAYEGNCLINAMSLGIMREEEIILAVAAGPGNLVMLIGSTTGRDGIGGASTCSQARSSTSAPRTSARRSRWATRSRRSCSSRHASSSSRRTCSSDSGTAEPPGSPARSARWRAAGAWASTSTSRKIPAREDAMKPFEFMV